MLPVCLCRRIIPYVISVLSLTTIAQNSGAAQDAVDSISGPVWYRTMDVGVREFRFAIEESTSETGNPIRHLISFDEGAQKFLLDPFVLNSDSLQFSLKQTKTQYHGTLTIPKQNDLHATAILISGSGPQDRDETLLEHKPFWVIADHLSRNGIAVLRFDDRGVGQSTGNFDEATSEDFARDVEAAMTFVQKLQNLKGKPVGLIGHSEGGIIAPMVAVRRPETAFIVMLAGTGVNGRRILETQGQLVLQAEGVTDPQQLLLQRTLQSELLDFVLSEIDSEPVVDQDARMQLLTAELRKSIAAVDMSDEVLQEALAGGLKRLQTPWFRFFLTHEPAPVLAQVRCPVLALNGQKDVQVDSGLNLAAIKAALESGGNSSFEIVEFPGLNHLFQNCRTGGVSEYAEIEETIASQVLNKIADWIRTSAAGR